MQRLSGYAEEPSLSLIVIVQAGLSCFVKKYSPGITDQTRDSPYGRLVSFPKTMLASDDTVRSVHP